MCKIEILILFTGFIQFSHLATLRCYKSSLDDYTVYPLHDPVSLLNSTCMDHTLPTILYTFGFRGKCRGPATTAMLQGYIATKKRNVLLLDWEEEAKGASLGIALSYALYAVPNSKMVGKELGAAIIQLQKAGLPLDNLHLIGHSLGAHLMGYCGRWLREQGIVIPRITGLDPARALFEGYLPMATGLDRTCGQFVDVIHTNPGNYGSTKSIGTVDIWPNYSQDGMQPGCPRGSYPSFSWDDLCSHNRAVHYYVESLTNGTSFPAAFATSFDEWISLKEPTDSIYLGDLVNRRARGNYYLWTNDKTPFNRGKDGMKPDKIRKQRDISYFSGLISIIRMTCAGAKLAHEGACKEKN